MHLGPQTEKNRTVAYSDPHTQSIIAAKACDISGVEMLKI